MALTARAAAVVDIHNQALTSLDVRCRAQVIPVHQLLNVDSELVSDVTECIAAADRVRQAFLGSSASVTLGVGTGDA